MSDLTEKNNQTHNTKRKKPTFYDIRGCYTIGCTYEGEIFIIDTDDLDKVQQYNWRLDNRGYIRARTYYPIILLHRLVTNCPKGLVVDHINHDKRDNRKSNLRIVTDQQNHFNQKKRRDNTSGFPGVKRRKGRNKWYAEIRYNRKDIHLGYFSTKEQAIEARKAAELKYFGEYAYKEDNMSDTQSEIIYGQKPLFPDRSYVELVRKDNNKLDLIHSVKGNVYTNHYVLKDASCYEPFKAFILQMVDPNESDEENVIGIAEGGEVEDVFEWVDYDSPAWDTTLAVEINELDRYLLEAETRLEIHYYKEGYYFQHLDDKSEGEIVNFCNFHGINYNKPLDGYSTDYWEGVVSTLRYLTLADEGKHSCDVFG